MTKLYKTTIVIISDYDPTYLVEIEKIQHAISGDSYCTEHYTEEVDASSLDSCVLEFFNVSEDESEDDQT